MVDRMLSQVWRDKDVKHYWLETMQTRRPFMVKIEHNPINQSISFYTQRFFHSLIYEATHDRCFRTRDHWKCASIAEWEAPDRPWKSNASLFNWAHDCCMWRCSCHLVIKYDRYSSLWDPRRPNNCFCLLVTPLDVVKTRLQSQEISGIRHLDGTLVRKTLHGSV